MPEPLNPTLYNLLQRNLPGGVQVSCDGEAFVGDYHRDPISGERRLFIRQRGEQYFGNCPICGDTRGRLYVNHRWGVIDKEGNDNLFLSYCFNEECTSKYEGMRRLKDMIFRLGRNPRMNIRRGKILKDSERYDPLPPGPIKYLTELPPMHPAVEYLEERGFDVQTLVRKYGVGYCERSHKPLACNRIYIPFVQHGKLMGWQMRYIGTPEGKWPPRYYSCPKQPAKKMLYNFDTARKYTTICVVEGPIDVWGIGSQGVGLIGKKLSAQKLELLTKHCKDSTLVIMLDPKQPESEAARGKPHQIEAAYEAALGKFKGGVVKVYLPGDSDPGELERDYMIELIRDAAREQGCKVRFGKTALRK